MTVLSPHLRLIAGLAAVAFVAVGVLQTDGTPGRVAIAAWISALALGIVAQQAQPDVIVRAALIGVGVAWCLFGLVALLASATGVASSAVAGCMALLVAAAATAREPVAEVDSVSSTVGSDEWGDPQMTSWSGENDVEGDW